MSLDTYSGLVQSIADHLDRDDLTTHIDDFINVAEARHKREIRIRNMIERDSIAIDDRYVALPTGFLEAKTLRLLTSPVTVLTYVNLHEMNRIRGTTGKPKYFTVHDGFEFDVAADESYSGEIVFYKELTALSDVNASNALLTRAPDVYLYSSLMASAPFLMNDERVKLWNELYMVGRNELNATDRRVLRIGPLVARPAGATP